jgi:hypothetical protein
MHQLEKKKKKSLQWPQMGPTVGSGLTLELEAGTLVIVALISLISSPGSFSSMSLHRISSLLLFYLVENRSQIIA